MLSGGCVQSSGWNQDLSDFIYIGQSRWMFIASVKMQEWEKIRTGIQTVMGYRLFQTTGSNTCSCTKIFGIQAWEEPSTVSYTMHTMKRLKQAFPKFLFQNNLSNHSKSFHSFRVFSYTKFEMEYLNFSPWLKSLVKQIEKKSLYFITIWQHLE